MRYVLVLDFHALNLHHVSAFFQPMFLEVWTGTISSFVYRWLSFLTVTSLRLSRLPTQLAFGHHAVLAARDWRLTKLDTRERHREVLLTFIHVIFKLRRNAITLSLSLIDRYVICKILEQTQLLDIVRDARR